MFKISTLLAAVVIVASVPASLDAKNPKGCKRTNVRPANPQGSVLMQPAASSVAASTGAPVMVFGSARSAAGESAATGTVVPGITSEQGPNTSSTQPPRKTRKTRRSAATDPSSLLGAIAIDASSSC